MIALAKKRNAAHVAAGKASFQTISLRDADFGDKTFDKIFAIRIGVFVHGQPAPELEVIKKHLSNKGSVYLFYDPAVASQVRGTTKTLKQVLEQNNFSIKNILTKPVARTNVVCVIAGKE
jgi:predicted GNAT family N-acyltransferase